LGIVVAIILLLEGSRIRQRGILEKKRAELTNNAAKAVREVVR
jgi:hypothetical protein